METTPKKETAFASSLEDIKRSSTGETFQCMLDIETLSTTSDAVILAISYVVFKKDEKIFKECIKYFRTITIDVDSQVELYKRTTSESTIKFWDEPKRAEIKTILQENKLDLKDALSIMSNELSKVRIDEFWANSPSFDMVILESAFNGTNLEKYIPWRFFQLRDVRTLSSFHSKDKKQEQINDVLGLGLEEGMVEHHPLFDCLLQIRRVHGFFHYFKKIDEGGGGFGSTTSLSDIIEGKKLKIEVEIKRILDD